MGQEDSPQLTGSSGSYGLSSNAVKELGGLHKMAKAPTSYMQTWVLWHQDRDFS